MISSSYWDNIDGGVSIDCGARHEDSRSTERFNFLRVNLLNVDRVRTHWFILAGKSPIYVNLIVDIRVNSVVKQT